MTIELTTRGPSPTLLRRLEERRAEIARFRAQHGDPGAALHAFMRETFDEAALIEAYEEYLANPYDWLERADPQTDG